MPIVSAWQVSTNELLPHHLSVVNRLGKTANIIAKKLFHSQPVVGLVDTTREVKF
jgi:hypothetical protein